MEKWICPHCGEELLGAANRCWKCGQRVRKPLPAPIEVQVAHVPASAPVMQLTADDVSLATAKEPPRRGSPFAIEASAVGPPLSTFYGAGPYRAATVTKVDSGPRMPHYPRNTSAIGGVTAALVLGGFSFVVLYFSVLGGLIALMGIACAVWGLFSHRKGLAIFALILCCLALTLSAWRMGFMLYEIAFPPTAAPATGPGGV